MSLYIVHDKDYSYKLVIEANNSNEAIEKLHKWLKETKQDGECFNSNTAKWDADICDNDIVIV